MDSFRNGCVMSQIAVVTDPTVTTQIVLESEYRSKYRFKLATCAIAICEVVVKTCGKHYGHPPNAPLA
jgi:hypothetical protein